MIKALIFLISLSQVFCLSCIDNEVSKKYKDINSDSTLETAVCTPCTKNSQSCLDNTDKEQMKCFDGYYLLKTDTIYECVSEFTKLTGCLVKTSDGKCEKCEQNYWLNSNRLCVEKTGSFKDRCKVWQDLSTTEKCKTALSGYSLVGEELITCFNQCKSCANLETCDECIDGYHLGDQKKSCVKNTGNCKTWVQESTTEKCGSCEDGYTINGNFCYNSQCACSVGYGPQYPSCTIQCTDVNCKQCSAAATCTVCKEQYFLKEDNTCGQCSAGCKACSSSTVCTQCLESHYFKDNACTACTNLDASCLICSSIFCARCSSLKTLNTDTHNCVDFSSFLNCQTTNNGGTCQTCQEGYYLDSTCIKCKDNCQICASSTACGTCNNGYYLNEGSCVQCQANCAKCTDGISCKICNTNYILKVTNNSNSQCVACTEEYSKYQTTQCTSSQFVEFPWKCANLTSNCLKAGTAYEVGTISQICETCNSGYKLKDDKTCEKCDIENCDDCSDGKDSCKICKAGYFKDGTKCTKCLENCNQCTVANVCLDCKTGYAFSSTLNECIKCADANCEWCSKKDVCVKCLTAYYLNSTYQCQACKSTCQECYNSTQCYQCKDTYYLKDFGCYACIENCLKCENAGTCKTCKEGFIADSSYTSCMNKTLCKANSPNCKTCSVLNTVLCSECNENYYISQTLCYDCLDNCKTCTNKTSCSECKDGYELNNAKTSCSKITINELSCFSVITGCIQCDSTNLLKCKLCAQGSAPKEDGTCSCQSGYTLVSGSCVQQDKLSINFDSDLSDKDLSALLTYIDQATQGTKKANNTEKLLKQLKSKFTDITSESAGKAAGILLGVTASTTNLNAQNYYNDVLKSICTKEGLDDSVYLTSMLVSDSFYPISNKTMRQQIYEYGFTNCVSNLMKKANPGNMSLLKLSNSQFQIKKLEINSNGNFDQSIDFADTNVIASIDLKTYLLEKSSSKQYYMIAQSINNDANPYAYKQNNTILFESKIISVQIMSKESSTDTNAPVAVDIELSSKKSFNITFDFAGSKCGYYDEDKLQWKYHSNATGKTCMFNHTTPFVIYQDSTVVAKYAQIIQIMSLVGILLIAVLI